MRAWRAANAKVAAPAAAARFLAPLVPLVSPLLRLSPLLRRSLSPPPLSRTAPELWRRTFWDAPTAGDARGEVVLARRSAKRDGLEEDDSEAAAWRVSPSSSKACESFGLGFGFGFRFGLGFGFGLG